MDGDSKAVDPNVDLLLPPGGVERTVSTRSTAELIKDDNDAERCGCGSCTRSWMQCFKGVKFFTFVTLFALISKVIASSYFGAVVSTLERQFNMDSVKSALLLVINDIMDFTFIIFITHFGHRGHRPRWIGIGLLMAAAGCFLCVIPHIMTEYKNSSLAGKAPLCKSNVEEQDYGNYTEAASMMTAEEEELSSMWSSVFWLMLGQTLIGIGNTPLKPLGTTYIDDSVEDHKTGFYVAMLFLATPIGAIIGYMSSFVALQVYVDFDRVPKEEWPRIKESDPRWIGAWWVGFALAAALLAVSSLPFFLFPKQPKDCRKKPPTANENPQPAKVQSPRPTKRKKSVVELLKGLCRALKRMFTNPAMVFICLSSASSSAAYAVSGAFGIKYFVDEFGKSNSSASIVGIAILPMLILAYIVGGYVIKRWKLNAKQCALFGLIVDAPSCLMYFLLIFVGCPTSDVAGVSVPYNTGSIGNISLIVECNNRCACPEIYSYEPVCINNVTYVSPCHAGCTASQRIGRKRKYTNCTCDPDVNVENGACAVDDVCNKNFLIAVLLIIIALGTSSLGRSADIIVTLRCVDKEDRTLALGIKIFLVNILAFFPAPVYFGALLNWSCLEFAYKTNGERGTCLIYDRTRYRYVYYGMYTALHLCGLFCWFMVYLTVQEKNKGRDTPDEPAVDQEEEDNL